MNPYDEDADDDPIESYDDDQMEVVTYCSDRAQAESIQELLADHDISVEIDDEGCYGDEDDGIALIAPAVEVEDARIVLERLDVIEEITVAETDDEVDEFEDDEEDDPEFGDELLEIDDEDPLSYDESEDDEDGEILDEEEDEYY